MDIQQALQLGLIKLHDTDSPEVDSQYLLCHVLDCELSYLRIWPEKLLTPEQQSQFENLLAQRQKGIPVAHLIGSRGFWTLDLNVNKHTLIPRPDTELLVERALKHFESGMQIVDLGTGSGAVALAMASERSDVKVFASDYSLQALEVAVSNAQKYHLDNVFFWQGSWLNAIAHQSVDIVVSNPPYIEQTDPHLHIGDVRFEPIAALAAGDDGLDDIRQIIVDACQVLKRGGWLLLEHGYQQASDVAQLFKEAGFSFIHTYQDFGGNDRVTEGQLAL
jgi:release factor glutamine methyltransferase